MATTTTEPNAWGVEDGCARCAAQVRAGGILPHEDCRLRMLRLVLAVWWLEGVLPGRGVPTTAEVQHRVAEVARVALERGRYPLFGRDRKDAPRLDIPGHGLYPSR